MRALIICFWLLTVMQPAMNFYVVFTGAVAIVLSWNFSKIFTIIIIISATLMQLYNWFYIPSAVFFLTLFVTIFMLPGGNSKAHQHNYPWGFHDIGGF